MKEIIKKLIPEFLLKKRKEKYLASLIANWRNNSEKGAPPHIIKQLHIKNLRTQLNLHVLVETGTYLGEMVKAQAKEFKKIITIEVSESIYKKTSAELAHLTHVEFILGDSGQVLQELVKKLTEPTLFWLDGHYSGGVTSKGELNTPIYKELHSIFNSNFEHSILIDDARDFKGTDDYPTIEELKNFVLKYKPSCFFTVKDNLIFILPKQISIDTF